MNNIVKGLDEYDGAVVRSEQIFLKVFEDSFSSFYECFVGSMVLRWNVDEERLRKLKIAMHSLMHLSICENLYFALVIFAFIR